MNVCVFVRVPFYEQSQDIFGKCEKMYVVLTTSWTCLRVRLGFKVGVRIVLRSGFTSGGSLGCWGSGKELGDTLWL